MNNITDQEFTRFQHFIYRSAGISLSASKRALVRGRLATRLQHCRVASYTDYLRLLEDGEMPHEVQTAVDLLTTNETSFFRESSHFDFLRTCAMAARRYAQPFRVWSAACSSGEEPYSIAMVLADCMTKKSWEVVGSDISLRVLQRACAGHYAIERCHDIPPLYLRRFCLRGTDEQDGTLLIDRTLRTRVRFEQINLDSALPKIGLFDVIFLRNVMIYFNNETKRSVITRILSLLNPGGYLCIGHSESLHDIPNTLQLVAPSVYRKSPR